MPAAGSGKMLLDIAHLIDRKQVERYLNKFAATSASMHECQMQLSGPWPPYHFVHQLTRPAHPQQATSAPVQVPIPIPVLMPEAEPLPA